MFIKTDFNRLGTQYRMIKDAMGTNFVAFCVNFVDLHRQLLQALNKNWILHCKTFPNMRLFSFVIILSVVSNALQADDGRYRDFFSSRNKAFSIKLEGNIWYLRNVKGDTLYSLKDSGYATQSIFVSNNGEKLVIIDDYIDDLNIPAGPVLRFYNNGRLINSYRFADLVSSYCYCTHTVSHVRWILFDFSLSVNEDTFSLATYELYEYEFNIDGAILKKQRPQGYNDSASIVYGDYFHIQGAKNTWQLKVKKYMAGAKYEGDTVQFKAKIRATQGRQVFMIANGIDVTPERYRKASLTFNACFE